MAAEPTRVTLPLVFSANELARIRQGAGEQAPQAWARDTLLRFADDIQATNPAEPATTPPAELAQQSERTSPLLLRAAAALTCPA